MSRYKGGQSAKAVEKDFPHFVDPIVPLGGLGKRLDAMYEFHTMHGIKPQHGRGWRNEICRDHIRWCFADLAQSFDEPSQGPAPNYRAIITKSLIAKTDPSPTGGTSYFVDQSGLFLPDRRLDHIEISDEIRMVQTSFKGWAWQTCIRLNVNNVPGTYAVFIADGQPVHARAAVQTDNCEGNYAPLEIREYNPVKRGVRKTRK